VTDSTRALGQHARPLLAEAGSAGGIPSLSVGLVGRWAFATRRALAGDPGGGAGEVGGERAWSPTNYYGGKARLAGWIVSLLPALRPLAHPARLLEPEAVCWP
jgi:hypothetical protein